MKHNLLSTAAWFRGKRKKQKRQGILRPMRIISYLVLFLLDIFLFLILQSHFLLTVAAVMAVGPFFSIWGLFRLGGRLQFRMTAERDSVACGDSICLEFRIINPLWYAALDSRILLQIKNIFFDSEDEITVSMPVRMHGESALCLPVQVESPGRFRLECGQFVVQDMLGMVCYPVKSASSCEFCVYPRERRGDQEEVTGLLAGAAESEESHSRGSDFAEVSDIREYIPGDRIRDIHWKLSAKQDGLMVKERIAMAGSEMVVLLSFSSSREQVRELLETVDGMGKAFIRNQIPVRLLCWNQRQFSFEEFCCGTPSELLAAFGEIFRTSVYLRLCGEQEKYMKNCYPYLGNYLVAAHKDGAVQVEMHENV